MNVPDVYRGADMPLDQWLARGPSTPVPDRLDWHAIIAIFNRRIKLFAITAFVIFEVAQVLTMLTPNRYTATAGIALSRTPDQLAPKGSSVTDDEHQSSDVDTEVQVLTSRDLARRVSDLLGLQKQADFVGKGPDARNRAIDKLIGNLDVERVKNAFVINVSYQDVSAARAAAIANAYARLYADRQVGAKRAANGRATNFLAGQIERLRRQARDDMQAVQNYRVNNNLLSTNRNSLTEQEVSTFNQQVALARAQASEDSARLSNARRQLLGGGADIGQSLASPVIQGLRQQRATLSGKVADLSSRYGDKYGELVDARSQLRDLDMQIQTEVLRELSTLDAQARVSGQRLASLQGSLGSARQSLENSNKAMVTLDDLTRRATTSQAVYESYLDRYKAVTAQSGTEAADATLLSEADVPSSPSSPHVVLNLLLGAVVGIGTGAAAAIGAELFFTGLTTGDEVEQRLGLPYLGGVPALNSIAPREATPLGTVEQFPQGAFAESFRAVLGSIRHGREGSHGVIAITSALPGEGKSTLAICLAAANALGGTERVIAVDCDIIRHRLSDLVSPKQGRVGLREVLRDGAPIEDALVQVGESNLFVLPVTTPFGKDEQITRGGMVHALVAKLREYFPLIVLDCPPLLPVAESRDLVAIADDAVLVAAWRKTKKSAITSATRLLPPAVLARTGVVLTRIDMKKQARFGAGDATSFYRQYREYYT